jgi:hypothetical protein
MAGYYLITIAQRDSISVRLLPSYVDQIKGKPSIFEQLSGGMRFKPTFDLQTRQCGLGKSATQLPPSSADAISGAFYSLLTSYGLVSCGMFKYQSVTESPGDKLMQEIVPQRNCSENHVGDSYCRRAAGTVRVLCTSICEVRPHINSD